VIAAPLALLLAASASAGPREDLGRMLFYDPRLSADRAVSCATCHSPSLDWRDGLARARGVSLEDLGVRTPSLLAVPASRLAAGTRAALSSPRGLDRDPDALARDLARLPGYRRAFASAEGGPPDAARAADALTAFLRGALAAPEPPVSGARALAGRALFRGKARCVSCHSGRDESDGRAHDLGWGPAVTPGLRGVAAGAPYGRRGQWPTLRAVVDFFDAGAGGRAGLEPLGLSAREREELTAYLLARRPPAVLPPIPPLPPEGEEPEPEAGTAARAAPAPRAPEAAVPEAAGPTPLAEADRDLDEAESVVRVLTGDAARRRCVARTPPEELYAELARGRLAGATLGALPEDLLALIRAERRRRALADGSGAPCGELLTLEENRLGFAPSDAAECRAGALDLAAAKALAARDPDQPARCRAALAAERPDLPEAAARAACRTLRERVADPERLCAELPRALTKETSREECVAEFARYARPPRTPRAGRGPRERSLDLLAAAAPAKDPALCAGDGDCLAALSPAGAGRAADESLRRARDAACAYAARPRAASADPARAKALLVSARAAIARAEAARAPEDRAAAAAVDARAERAARIAAALSD
jgi:cytochrome c peroxidase